jgi:hypothetical protein
MVINDTLGDSVGNTVIGSIPRNCWVAQITGYDIKYKYKRIFLKFKKDYSESNSVGSIGVLEIYKIESNKLYEVKEYKNRFFCVLENGVFIKLNELEANKWIEENLE